MNTYTIVRPEHLNHHGYLFGGAMLKWVDEFAWLVASKDYSGCSLVTRGMADIEFSHRVRSGSILRFSVLPVKMGTTSVTYSVEVFADEPGASEEKKVFSTGVTFVCVNDDGRKCPLPQKDHLPSQEM